MTRCCVTKCDYNFHHNDGAGEKTGYISMVT